MTSTALVPVRTRRVVTFSGGPRSYEARRAGVPAPAVVYDVPANTCDPRYQTCIEHRVACDCREAELAEQLSEHRAEWASLRSAFRRALVGHPVYAPGDWRRGEDTYPGLCLCSGCVVVRAHGFVLRWDDVDHHTGRVLPPAPSAGGPMSWAATDVPF